MQYILYQISVYIQFSRNLDNNFFFKCISLKPIQYQKYHRRVPEAVGLQDVLSLVNLKKKCIQKITVSTPQKIM